jgi:DNA-binding transcriptional regulator GbsR (MarR family)
MKQNKIKMTAAQHDFVDHMGQQMVGWNLPRTTGRVWAYLLMRGEPAVLDDIARDLDVAKSGASVGARQLVAFGLARSAGERGSRRVLFSAIDNMEAMFAARSESARSLQRLLREGARAASTSETRTTLTDMASGIEEILERESAALMARSRKGKRT